MEEEPVCGHSLHEVDTLVAEVAEVAGVCGGRLGGGGDIARQLRGGVVLGGACYYGEWERGGGRQHSLTDTA